MYKYGSLIDRLTARTWSADQIERYVGAYISSYTGYATDIDVRSEAASGGVTTALLIDALERKTINGALVCKTVIINNRVRARFYIASTREEILAARGSKYVTTEFTTEAIPLIHSFTGNLAVVGLPCEISLLQHYCRKNPVLEKKIKFTISLLCGHTSTPDLVDGFLHYRLKSTGKELKDFSFKKGHWRGHLSAQFSDHHVIKKAFQFNQYQNLFFFCPKKCLSCCDHFGYDADLCMGDVWLFAFSKNAIKHNLIITKTRPGDQLLRNASDAGKVALTNAPIQKVLDAQSRSIRLHYNITSRAKAGNIVGVPVHDTVHVKTKWHEDLLALLLLLNYRWSHSKNARIIFRIPVPFIKLYLYIIKMLEIL